MDKALLFLNYLCQFLNFKRTRRSVKLEVQSRDWSNLPGDIVASILCRLNSTETDRCRLGAVCTSWRAVLSHLFPQLSPLPLVEISPSLLLDGWCCKEDCGRLAKSTFHLVSGTGLGSRCLTRVIKDGDQNVKAQLWLFHNTRVLKDFPDQSVNLLDHHIWEVSESYSPCNIDCESKFRSTMRDDHSSVKAILSFKTDIMTLWGSEDDRWIKKFSDHVRFHDVLYYEGKFYAIEYAGKGRLICSIASRVF